MNMSRSSKDSVIQLRKYKEPNDELFEEFKDHIFRLRHEFYPRYYMIEKSDENTDNFSFLYPINVGSTVLAKHLTVGKYFAVKIIRKDSIVANNKINDTINEKRIAQAVRFPFLLHMEFCFKDNVNIYFVYPYMSSEDLFTFLKRNQVIKERDAKFYGGQILLALEYLHNIDILHRNIKPENIILAANGYVKLADFRFAKLVPIRTYSFCGTPEYMVPEMVLNKGYGKGVDWWAFGVLLFEMIAGVTPFYSSDPIKSFEKIVSANFKFNIRFSPLGQNLIRNILQQNISKRYGNLLNGSLDIKCHDWFEVMDWQKLYSQTLIPPYCPEMPVHDDFKSFDIFPKDIPLEQYEKEFEDF